MTTYEATEIEAAFSELAQLDLAAASLNETLERVATLAKRVVPGVDEASITVVDDRGRAKTVVFTSALAVQLDERQYETGFGPCLDAAETGSTIVLDHKEDVPLYPEFTRAALRASIIHTAAIPLLVPYRTAGALNLYVGADEPFSEATIGCAERFAGYAAFAVSNADRLDDAEELARQLQQAMRTRSIIEQAKGILMARHGFDADEAFRLLAKESQDTNTKLRDLAGRIVDHPRTPADG